MKIHVDLIHPANIHYFKNFIRIMKDKGHVVFITARDKDVLHKLLNAYELDFISSGGGSIGKGAFGKLLYFIWSEYFMFKKIIKIKPDIILSFGSSPCAHNSFLFRIPHITFEDTEHAKLNRKFYQPFTDFIGTPSCFYEDLGKNHFRFEGYMELFYLHKNRFKPNEEILGELCVKKNESYVFMRYVSWSAFHDIGQKGLSIEDKIKLVKLVNQYARVFISSEGNVPKELKEFEIKVSPEKIHDVLAFSKLYIGEGGTMASECAMLGIPSIYVNSLPLMGYLKDAQNAGLLYHLHEYEEIKKIVIEVLDQNKTNIDFKNINSDFLKDKIDPTAFLVWLIENYPASKKILEENPDYQYKFK